MFSDGVFAIAITLLILEIHVPDVEAGGTVLGSLAHEWASFLAFLIGFFTILICWINHHYMFTLIHRTNGVLSLLNGFKLLVVAITPFATALLAKHLGTEQQTGAVSVYCFNFALMGLAMSGIWTYASGKGLADAPSVVLRGSTWLYLFAGSFSTLIWLVSFVSTVACLVLSAIMFGIFIFPERAVSWLVMRKT